ncbi:MAG TPA: ABC transporter permease subunit, partial [Stellaceae bacterium]|nr:ABC transporter permease subunit [Stellaceae bacterium]
MTLTVHRTRNLVVLAAVIFVVWEGLFLYAGDNALKSPWQTFAFTGRLIGTEMFWQNFGETMTAFGLALAIAVGVGLSLGFWLGFHAPSGALFTPMLLAFASIPKVVLYPIVLLICGLGISAKVAFGAMHGIPPIALSTLGAIGTVRPVLLRLSRVMHFDSLETLHTIVVPAVLPEMMTGLRIGFSLTLIGTILGEMFASQQGLGYLLMTAIGLHNVDLIMSVTLVLAVLAIAASAVLLTIDRRLR